MLTDAIPFIINWLGQLWATVVDSIVLSIGFMLMFISWVVSLIVGSRQD